MAEPRCQRCPRRATHAVAVDGLVIALCGRHAAELADRLAADPRVTLGGRTLRIDPPALDRSGRP